ncbi:MAG: ABC transporter ATP-binding protein [Nakamurella sp.]
MIDCEGCTGLDGVTVVQQDGTVSLDNVTVLARPGELLAVLGPSGSGKSTLLRAIAGLTRIRSGRVLIAGRPTKAATGQRNLAMVFERTQLMPLLDVARNMAFGLETHHVPADEVRQRVEHQSRRLRVGKLLRRMPTELSTGEQSQVGVGRALVRTTPNAFLLDEPLAHIDAHERARMRRVIAETVRSSTASTFYVTHDQSDALAIGDRIAVLDTGRVAQIGTPRELYDRPANLFVADFIGPVALGVLPARLVVGDGMAGFRVGFRTLPTWRPVPAELAGWVDREVMLGLRAEDVHAADQGSDPDRTRLTGTVRSIENTGRHAFVTVGIADHRVVATFAGGNTLRPGEQVDITVDAARAHVFDSATGQALFHPAP